MIKHSNYSHTTSNLHLLKDTKPTKQQNTEQKKTTLPLQETKKGHPKRERKK